MRSGEGDWQPTSACNAPESSDSPFHVDMTRFEAYSLSTVPNNLAIARADGAEECVALSAPPSLGPLFLVLSCQADPLPQLNLSLVRFIYHKYEAEIERYIYIYIKTKRQKDIYIFLLRFGLADTLSA